MALNDDDRREHDRLIKAVAEATSENTAPIAALYEFCVSRGILERADRGAYDYVPEVIPEAT